MQRPKCFKMKQLLASIVALFCGGACGPNLLYLPSLAVGQFDAILRSVPIGQAIGSGNLSDEDVAKLRLIQDVRDYAIQVMGLEAGSSFTLYVDTGDSSRMFNVSASDKHRFRPVVWTFPFVGTVPYLVFFDRPSADREVDKLIARGKDVFMYQLDAYSTLNLIPNPVRSSMLRRDEISLVETVIHELLHDTVWKAGATPFNESLATFVGRIGAVEYVRERYPDEPERVNAGLARFEDIDRYNAFIFELHEELEAYYASDLSSDEKATGREAIFQAARERFAADVQPLMNAPENFEWVRNLPANNAWMLGNYRYNLDLDLFQQVFYAMDSDWQNSMDVFRSAARSDDPKAYLQDSLALLDDTSAAMRLASKGSPSDLTDTLVSPIPCEARGGRRNP